MSFKRSYAFESDVSADVKDMLEKVETVVDEKCETPEDCDKLVKKIEKKEDQFNDALKGMADAAKDCKDGKCDKSELKDKLDPHVSCLKTIAKDIGVASESDLVTDGELQDVKDYIEGAKEIVEAKKDELEGESGSDDEGEDKGDDAEPEDKETEDTAEECAESWSEDDETAFENWMNGVDEPAMEGQNWQALKGILGKDAREARKLARGAQKKAKDGDVAGAVSDLNVAKEKLAKVKKGLQDLPKDMWDTISSWVNGSLITIIYSFLGEGGWKDATSKNVNVAAVINYCNRAMQKIDEKIAALKSGGSEAPATESTIDSFIDAMEGMMISKKNIPYLFD